MSDTKSFAGDYKPFHDKIREQHSRVDPCFMTGKGCVYRDAIDRALRERSQGNSSSGFMVMPFRENLEVFYRNTLSPYFEAFYGGGDQTQSILHRADQVRRPGIIICEGICKRIQESDFIVVDISVPNDNVFYELGLAYGIGQKILIIRHVRSDFGEKKAAYLGCPIYAYKDLDPLDFTATQFLWRRQPLNRVANPDKLLLLYEHLFTTDPYEKAPPDNPKQRDISLSFISHVKSSIGLAIEQICRGIPESGYSAAKPDRHSVIASYRKIIERLKKPEEIEPSKTSFDDIRSLIDFCYCMVVRTGREVDPMSYFWLGYAHALGKNVIPVTIVDERPERPEVSIDDLAFDIRAQRHMTFVLQKPYLLENQINSTLNDMIYADFSEWSRKRFWDKMLGKRGEVYIFTGALHHESINREVVGDWDLRAASELTSYFSRHQYRAKIETPIYSIEYAQNADSQLTRDSYIGQLRSMMKGKNCILIASPDVNPLTEIVLGKMYDVPPDELFQGPLNLDRYPRAMVAVKQTERSGQGLQRAFYLEEAGDSSSGKSARGFRSRLIRGETLLKEFLSQQVTERRETFEVYAHLAIVPNPFDDDSRDGKHYIVVLNGVSGPATFALTHVLTGKVNEEFVSYDGFNPEAQSEDILNQILGHVELDNFRGLECIVRIKVGLAGSESAQTGNMFDWRQILGWELQEEVWDLERKIRSL